MTILAMHQPNFLPWAGFFHKAAQADIFVLMDTAQVPSGGNWANRAMIKTPGGPAWLTLPIRAGGKPSYKDQELATDSNWTRRAMKKLHCNYARSPYYNSHPNHVLYSDCIETIFHMNTIGLAHRDERSLARINTELIIWLMGVLGIDTYFTDLTTERIEGPKEELPILLCDALGADVYLSGTGARVYNEPERFESAGIELRYQEFKCPIYLQPWGEFLPDLSIIDLLFNCGPGARSILKGA